MDSPTASATVHGPAARTRQLSRQVFEGAELLLAGLERAAQRAVASGHQDWLGAALETSRDHVADGLVCVLLRLLFALYAEDHGLLPVDPRDGARGLLARLRGRPSTDDADASTGAYGQLLALFRALDRDERSTPGGTLFDPDRFPFLAGRLATADPVPVNSPAIEDAVVRELLERLVIVDGRPLDYRELDVELLGSLHEALIGHRVVRLRSPAVRLGKHGVWVEVAALRRRDPEARRRWLRVTCGLTRAQRERVEVAIEASRDDDELVAVLRGLASADAVAARGRLVLQPGDGRRRSGSHYTPRALTHAVVRRTLAPLLADLGDAPTPAQLLSLRVCDLSMGSGAFLVEACRQLAAQLVAAWRRARTLSATQRQHGDPRTRARALVARRCLYGVDKNELAVAFARLCLWLTVGARDLPLSFVDHALRHGDALVGLEREQVRRFHWGAGAVDPVLDAVVRGALADAPDARGADAREDARLIADLCVSAFLDTPRARDRASARDRWLSLVRRWLTGERALESTLRRAAAGCRKRWAPFHWWIELPELFAGDRACVGNPPFMGQARLSGELGVAYRDWLYAAHPGVCGKSDLAAHFLRRAAGLLGARGSIGLIATNTIHQGDTREGGVGRLVADGWVIYEATTALPWPGDAAVTVNMLHLCTPRLAARLRPVLDGQPVTVINSRLRADREREPPRPLRANEGLSFLGCKIGGQGFVLTPTQARALIDEDARNAARVRPYIGGDEVNAHPRQAFTRYVIDFETCSIEQAMEWPRLLSIVRARVKPYRERARRTSWRRRWWQFAEVYPAMRAAIAGLDRCLVTSRHQPHLVFSFQPAGRIFSEALYVFPLASYTAFAVLQSRVHEVWARLLCSSLEDRLRYTASDGFRTFPFPRDDPRARVGALERAGARLYEARARYMHAQQVGLTRTYNALADPRLDDDELVALRTLSEALDRAVLDAYGWRDLEVPPWCAAGGDDVRARQAFRDAIIDRLYELNAARARIEDAEPEVDVNASVASPAIGPSPGDATYATSPTTR